MKEFALTLATEIASLVSRVQTAEVYEAIRFAAKLIKHSPVVICTGAGKSGIPAEKLAANLASLNKTAFFVDAGRARHGDKGVFNHGAISVVYSQSGKSPEILDIFSGSLRPSIVITGNLESDLAKSALVSISSEIEGGEILGKLPAASCLLMLALSDIMTYAYVVEAGISEEDFLNNHPGGAIGAARA